MTSRADGAGLGLRRAMLGRWSDDALSRADFLELAPENWIGIGGRWSRQFKCLAERMPLRCHGLSLNLGGAAPLNDALLTAVRHFLDEHRVIAYSEHLSACGDDGQLYDLMPLPFSDEAVHHVARRIAEVQDRLERRIAIENVSAYLRLPGALDEPDFITAVLEAADCDLLLDVNNVYVNSVNFGFDPCQYIDRLPTHRIVWLHVAGHHDEPDGLKIDTHGSDVCDPVWALLKHTYQRHGVKPTLLERDFNLPAPEVLLDELEHIRRVQREAVPPLTTPAAQRVRPA